MVQAVYDLMGKHTDTPVDEQTVGQKVETLFTVRKGLIPLLTTSLSVSFFLANRASFSFSFFSLSLSLFLSLVYSFPSLPFVS